MLTNTFPATENTTFAKEHLSQYLKENNLDRDTPKEFTIPNGVTEIGRGVFKGCTSLTSITLPPTRLVLCNKSYFYIFLILSYILILLLINNI